MLATTGWREVNFPNSAAGRRSAWSDWTTWFRIIGSISSRSTLRAGRLPYLKECRAASARTRSLSSLFEFWPYGLRNAGRDPVDLLAMLRDLGFEILTAKGSTIASTETSAFLKRFRARRYLDLLAIRP